jgi:putative flippase GtrA
MNNPFNIVDKTVWRFVVVGVLNTIVGTAIMFIFYNVFHFDYWISSAANYFFGSILSYFLNKYYTFSYRKKEWKSAVRFVINIILCYLIAYGIAKPTMSWLLSGTTKAVQENIAMVFGMGLFVVLNYFGQRFYTFNNKN